MKNIEKNAKKVVVVVLVVLMLFNIQACKKNVKPNGKYGQGKADLISSKNMPDSLKNTTIKVLTFGEAARTQYPIDQVEKLFKEKYNGEIQYTEIPVGQIPTRMVMASGAGEPFDVVFYNNTNFYSMINKGLTMPLDDYIDFNDSIFDIYREAHNAFSYQGKKHGVIANAVPYIIMYNETMFNNNGIKTPIEYYREGKWNWETLDSVARQFVQDTTRDGTIDQWGLAMTNAFADAFVLSNGGQYLKITEDGTAQITLMDSKVAEALQFFQDAKIKHNYLIDKLADFASNKVAMRVERTNTIQIRKQEVNFEWGIAPFPQGPNGVPGQIPGTAAVWAMQNGAINPEGAAAYLYLLYNAILENDKKALEETFTDDQLKVLEEMGNNLNINMNLEGMQKIMNSFVWGPLQKGTPVINVIEQTIPSLQELVNEFNKK